MVSGTHWGRTTNRLRMATMSFRRASASTGSAHGSTSWTLKGEWSGGPLEEWFWGSGEPWAATSSDITFRPSGAFALPRPSEGCPLTKGFRAVGSYKLIRMIWLHKTCQNGLCARREEEWAMEDHAGCSLPSPGLGQEQPKSASILPRRPAAPA